MGSGQGAIPVVRRTRFIASLSTGAPQNRKNLFFVTQYPRLEDAEVHGSGVEIDAAVESVLLVGEARGRPRRNRWGPEPALWLERAPFLKTPR
jgi:hypothetical protein